MPRSCARYVDASLADKRTHDRSAFTGVLPGISVPLDISDRPRWAERAHVRDTLTCAGQSQARIGNDLAREDSQPHDVPQLACSPHGYERYTLTTHP